MDPLIEKVAGFLERDGLFPVGRPVVVAVSGGLDSMVLLRVLHALRSDYCRDLIVAHFNHRLRGRESDADERLVRETVAELGVEYCSERAAPGALQRIRKESVEMASREARHRFLVRTAREVGAKTVALAHHADDQAELFLLRLLRGSGDGLAGMRPAAPSPFDASIRLIRPLLEVSRAELRAFVERRSIPFREDASNHSRAPERNRVRHELLPLLDGMFDRRVSEAILRSREIIAGESDCVEGVAKSWLQAGRRRRFDRLHPAVQRQCLRLRLLESGIVPGFDLIEALRPQAGRWVSVAPDKEVARDEDCRIQERGAGMPTFTAAEWPATLAGPGGEIDLPGRAIRWRIRSIRGAQGAGRPEPGTEMFDADRVGTTITLRHWRRGDRFQPIGMDAPVKLQDWFTNLKIPRAERHRLLLGVGEGGEIFWVEGQRIGERFKLRASTRRRLVWSFSAAEGREFPKK